MKRSRLKKIRRWAWWFGSVAMAHDYVGRMIADREARRKRPRYRRAS